MWDEGMGLMSEGRFWFIGVGGSSNISDPCEEEKEEKKEK